MSNIKYDTVLITPKQEGAEMVSVSQPINSVESLSKNIADILTCGNPMLESVTAVVVAVDVTGRSHIAKFESTQDMVMLTSTSLDSAELDPVSAENELADLFDDFATAFNEQDAFCSQITITKDDGPLLPYPAFNYDLAKLDAIAESKGKKTK